MLNTDHYHGFQIGGIDGCNPCLLARWAKRDDLVFFVDPLSSIEPLGSDAGLRIRRVLFEADDSLSCWFRQGAIGSVLLTGLFPPRSPPEWFGYRYVFDTLQALDETSMETARDQRVYLAAY